MCPGKRNHNCHTEVTTKAALKPTTRLAQYVHRSSTPTVNTAQLEIWVVMYNNPRDIWGLRS
jgi:hypothetical protein